MYGCIKQQEQNISLAGSLQILFHAMPLFSPFVKLCDHININDGICGDIQSCPMGIATLCDHLYFKD